MTVYTCRRFISCFSVKLEKEVIFNKYKTFSVLIYSYINTSGKWENEKRGGVFSHNFEFSQFPRVLI